jgi:iron complex transport system substrate-binding protein
VIASRVPSRRGVLIGAAAGAVTLSACSSSETPATGGGGSTSSTRVVKGALGDITVPAEPRRIVSVGQYRDTDAAVALGVVPLLSPDLSAFLEGGVSPWVEAALDGAELPLYDSDELPYEEIIAARPDLILATDRSALEGQEYATLSKIAPTLSWQNGYNKDDWRTTTLRVGDALGLKSEAAGVVARVEGAVTAARSDHRQLTGKTFTLGPVLEADSVNTINSVDDASARFFNELGLVLAPSVRKLEDTAFPGRSTVSLEQLDLLDADVMMLTFNNPQVREELESNPVFQQLPAVREGRYVALDLPAALAMGFPSALSIEYALEQVLPLVVDVVG